MIDNFLEPFRNLKKRVSDIPGVGAMLDLAKGGAETAIQWPIDFIKKNISKVGDIAVDIADAANAGTAKAQVRAVAMKYGWGAGREWDAIKWIVQKESSWNPRAANPTSSARGLFQQMTSIHGPVAKTAAGQAGWGLKYIKNRYGSPTRAQAFWRRNNWYADGGLVKPHVFDGGGWLTDRMVAIHQKRRPDAVLSESQWRDMHTIAQNTARRQGEGTTINITVNGVDTDNAQAVAQELRFELARIAKGGKYALGNA